MVSRRGQLILTAAILIGLTIVASAVLLNQVHASADVQAQQDRQSLEETERIIEQLNDQLSDLFFEAGTSEDEPAPYLQDEDSFSETASSFNDQYTNLSTLQSSGMVSVNFSTSESHEGIVVIGNQTTAFTRDGTNPSPWNVIEDATGIPYVFLEIEGGGNQGDDMTVTESADDTELEVKYEGGDEFDIRKNDDPICEGLEGPFEIEIINGVGAIQDDGTVCEFRFGDVATAEELEFDPSQAGDEIVGNYTVVGDEGDTSDFSPEPSEGRYLIDDVITNPHFQVTYHDPQITYQTNVMAYGGEP